MLLGLQARAHPSRHGLPVGAFNAGGHASGRGAFGRESVPTTHTVVDLAGDDDRRGYELYLGRKIKWLPEVEGRLSRADIINWQHALGKRT